MEEGLGFNLGQFGEDEACKFLRKQGCKILARNYRTRAGEIDIIARSAQHILFVEVKTRASGKFAQPWESVGFRKRQNLKAAAKQYAREHDTRGCDFRFDVISIVLDDAVKPVVEWIQSAF